MFNSYVSHYQRVSQAGPSFFSARRRVSCAPASSPLQTRTWAQPGYWRCKWFRPRTCEMRTLSVHLTPMWWSLWVCKVPRRMSSRRECGWSWKIAVHGTCRRKRLSSFQDNLNPTWNCTLSLPLRHSCIEFGVAGRIREFVRKDDARSSIERFVRAYVRTRRSATFCCWCSNTDIKRRLWGVFF